MRIRKEQLAALGAKKAAKQRQELLAEFQAKGLEAKEEAPGGDVLVRDKLRRETRLHAEGEQIEITTAEHRQVRLEHNGHGQLRRITDPAGAQIKYEYDKKGRLSEIQRGSHSKFGFAYDEHDGVTEIRYPDGTSTNYVNDAAGHMIKAVDRNKNISRRAYDPRGRLTSMSDWQGNETRLEYDEFDLPSEVIQPNGTVQEFAYNEEGELAIMSVNNQEHAHFLRDDDDGLYKIDYVDGCFTYLKHENNRLLEAQNESSTVKFEYDGQGRVLKEETNGKVVEYVRDDVGNLAAIVGPDGRRITFGRDKDHRVDQITDWDGKQYDVEYHKNGALGAIRFPNGTSVEQETSEIGLPSSLLIRAPRHSFGPVVDRKYEYDVCDRLVREQRTSGEIRYKYDGEGRLLEAANTQSEHSEQFRLDPNGNRVADASGACKFNGLNQLTQRDGQEFAYDPLGNMTSGGWDGKQFQFRYNGRGQVVQAISPQGTAEYEYDAVGRRILKRFGGRTTRYIWAGSQLLAEIRTEGNSVRQRDYLFFEGKPLPLAMREGEQTYFFHCGRRCEPLAMTDDAGQVVWQAEYTSFGKAQISELAHRFQPFRLAGQYFDEETGLHYNVARYYVPELGRFLSMDPLRETGGSLNLYNYCDGDPLNRTDPNGEFIFMAIAVGIVVGAVIGAAVESYRQYKEVQAGNENAYSPLKILGAAAIGGLIGGIGGGVGAAVEAGMAAVVGTSILAGGAVGAVSGAVSSVAEQCAEAAVKKEELNPAKIAKQAAIDGLIGGAIGLVTGGIGGIFARRAKKAAVKASNLVEDHAKAISNVAKGSDEVIMLRPVNPNATDLIKNGHPTKSMHVKGKSADSGPIAGLIPVDPKKSKLGPNASPADVKKYGDYNQKAIDSGKATTVDVELPNGEKVAVLADPKTGKPLTADYDLFAVGPNKKKGHGKIEGDHPDLGTISDTEKRTVEKINEGVQGTGYSGGDVAHHGPANRFADELDPVADFPITAFTPDGRIHTIKDPQQLDKFMKKQNKKGYQLEQREGWGLDSSIPVVENPS